LIYRHFMMKHFQHLMCSERNLSFWVRLGMEQKWNLLSTW